MILKRLPGKARAHQTSKSLLEEGGAITRDSIKYYCDYTAIFQGCTKRRLQIAFAKLLATKRAILSVSRSRIPAEVFSY